MFDLHLLGGAFLEDEHGLVGGRVSQRRRLALLALLARAGVQGIARERLASYLWPEAEPAQSRHLLADSLYVLRSILGKDALIAVGENVRLNPVVVDCDATRFEAAIASGEMETAVDLYAGDFLDGFFISGAPEFERWADTERERLMRAYEAALTALGTAASERGDSAGAVGWLQRAVERQPENSRVVLNLMRAHVACGDRANAIACADRHEVYLREELDAEADPVVAGYARRLRADGEAWEAPPHAFGVPGPQSALSEMPLTRASKGILQSTGIGRTAAASFLGLLLMTIGVWAIRSLIQPDGSSESVSIASAVPSIAILPFRVQGGTAAVLREGMVDLLSTGLGEAGSVRAIDPATLLARWRETVTEGEEPELSTRLEIARQTGSRYAVVGSVIALGSEVRLSASVYDLRTDEQLGQGQVDGPESSLLQLVDRLALEILRIVFERGEEELPKIDLASITTESPEALRAYLEGEVSFRHFDLQAAVEAFKRAVEADSMFALAHYRLADTYMWPTVDAGNSEYHLERAVELSDRLPAEEKVLVKALLALEQQSPEAIESLRELVEMHPENPEAWYLLADTYLHVTGDFATAEEIRGMFARAVQLDPKNAKYLLHHVQFAWWYEPDSSMAAKRLEVFEQVAPRHPLGPAGHYAIALAFGNPANQLAASSRLRQEEDPEVVDDVMRLLFHPRYTARPYVLEQRLRFSDDPRIFVGVAGRTHVDLFWNYAMWHGQLRRGLSHLEQLDSAYDAWRAELLYTTNLAGLPITQEKLQGFALIDSTAENWQLYWGGVLAADNGRWSDHSRAIAEFRRRKERALEASDSLTAEWRESAVLALEAHGSWRKDNLADALPIFSDAPRFLGGGQFSRWRLARVYQGLGRLKDAEQVYNSFHFQDAMAVEPLSQFQLGKIYEALNEYEKAIQSYDYFVEYWKDADAELQPMVEDARRAMIRLRGPRRE